MSNARDFLIEKGTLKKYRGQAKDVVIPEDVKRIAGKGRNAFDYGAFVLCKRLKSITIQGDSITIGGEAFFGCDNLTSIAIMSGDSITIEKKAFLGCNNLTSITIMSSDADIDQYAFMFVDSISTVFAPRLPHAALRACGLGMPAARTFIEQHQDYTDESIVKEYIAYIAAQRKKLLPMILERDSVGILRLLADAKKITKKNVEQEYLLPAMQCKAHKCVALLESMFGLVADTINAASETNALWDGQHFSLDGKKLLRYPEEPGRTVYEVPDGTIEICKSAFCFTELEQIILPESVVTVRNDSFAARDDCPLFIRFPKSLQKIPASIFLSSFEEDYSKKYYYVSTPISGIAEHICMDSAFSGHGRIIYTGGPIDDLPSATKKYAVLGFVYAEQHDLEDLSKWRGSYLDHIKRNEKTYLKQALSDAFLLNLMLEESLLSAKGTKTLLNEAEANGRTDLTAALLEYQQKNFGGKDNDTLSLSDDDPEFKRMQKTAARREAIKDQKGIKGIVFVQTGDMLRFGYYDEYTGAKDMTDLKEFIEARGGFLRSAISSNTDYLICNDPNSDTIKSKKAKELGVPVITEEQFLKIAEEKE